MAQEFTMSMFASKAGLYKAKAEYYETELRKLRLEMVQAHAKAANPGPYLDDSELGFASGEREAYGEVVCALNKLL